MMPIDPRHGDWIREYLTDLRYNNRAPETLASYTKTLSYWMRSGDENPRRWIADLRCGGVTKHRYMRELRAYFNFLVNTQRVPENPFEGQKMSLPERLPRRAEPDEVKALLQAASVSYYDRLPKGCMTKEEIRLIAARNQAIIALIGDTAIRSREAARAIIEDLDLGKRELKVVRKGNRQDWVKFGPRTTALIRSYLSLRVGAWPESPLFASRRGGRLQPKGIQDIFYRAAHRALGRSLGSHAIRHFALCRELLLTGNMELVKEMAGHRTLAMTDRYVRLLKLHLRDKYRSPMDDLL